MFGVGDDECARVLPGVPQPSAAVVLSGEGLVAQRELQAVVGGLQAGLFQRAFDLRLLALQQAQGLGRSTVTWEVTWPLPSTLRLNVDAAEFRRIEPDVELAGAGLRLRRDRDREAGDRHAAAGRGRCRAAV